MPWSVDFAKSPVLEAPVPVLIERIVAEVRRGDHECVGALVASLSARAEPDDLFLLRERLAADLL
ncbi:hypothetical protein [Kitasatospora sp. NPDC050543]|uniref:hypothetical protein n=1 Tax=Kitasatospora sp. NPDC050543 TaxID=3364054 RepID=UPI0037AB1B5F